MKTRFVSLVGAAVIAALSLSCGTTSAYEGPVGDHPVVSVTTLRHVDSVTNPTNPTWARITTLHVSNPSNKRAMKVVVDCDKTHQPQFQGTPNDVGGTRMHLTLDQRTTQDVLLAPSDGDCVVTEE
jgi:hypothetical protein